MAPARKTDILVAGAGAAGLSAALALARAGFEVVCVGGLDRRANGRTVALFEASLRFYRALGLWPALKARSAPIARIAMIDATGSRFKAPTLAFAAAEIGLSAFGANVENHVLVEELERAARAAPGLSLRETMVADASFGPDEAQVLLADGERVEASLVVAADGRASLIRSRAGLEARAWRYPQTALTALLAHEKPHRSTSTEFHTRAGPCTLVPLAPREGAPFRSSLVWLMEDDEARRRAALSDAELAAEVEAQVGSLLGGMTIEGARGAFAMAGMIAPKLCGPRVALVGETAHVFPPLAAQGLNLSLRDVAALVEAVEDARAVGQDVGSPLTLEPYDRARRGDVGLRAHGVDLLNRSFLSAFAPVDLLRGAGFAAFAALGPLRRALMREGVLTHGALPRLMQAPRPVREPRAGAR
ncbi:FAD-dependent monooxygenase [Methylocella sp.]|uniref:FAD-dependent monooxygenase n=1 Tax=Methylocella sp. TaxID=1978226 RepID=UPI003784B7AE